MASQSRLSYRNIFASLLVTSVLALLLAIFLCSGLVVQAAPATPEIYGSIGGTVRDEEGHPLSNIVVELYRRYEYGSYSGPILTVVTDGAGRYHFSLVPTGIYILRYRDPVGHFTTQYYPAIDDPLQATDISVSGDVVTGIDAQMRRAGTITGMITVTNGLTLGESEITLYGLDNRYRPPETLLLSPNQRHYTFAGLIAGHYQICAQQTTASPAAYHFYECYDDHLYDYTTFLGDPITVTAGITVSNVDFVFGDNTNLVTIDGAVIAPIGQHLAGITITADRWWSGSWSRERETQSSADGTFQLPHLVPGRYALYFADPQQNYLLDRGPASPGAIDLTAQSAITVDLPAGGDHASLVVKLIPAAAISGTITVNGEPLGAPGNVTLYRVGNDEAPFEIAATPIDPLTGHYHFRGLVEGTYQLYAVSYVDQVTYSGYYGGTPPNAAANLVLGRSAQKADANITLQAETDLYRSTMAGHVTDQGVPVAGIKVTILHRIFDGDAPVAFTETDEHGYYQFAGLRRDVYKLSFQDPQGIYATTYYSDARSIEGGKEIWLEEAQTVTTLDVALTVGGRIHGTVRDRQGQPVPSVLVITHWFTGQYWYSSESTTTNGEGQYQLPPLLPDTYRLEFSGKGANRAWEFYENATSVESATDLVVASGADLTVDIVLGPESVIYLPVLRH